MGFRAVGRAAVFEAPNVPFAIREFPLRPAGPGEVLVRVAMATLCRSDIHSYQGHRPSPCPGILGHEIIGRILELGPGVGRDLRGDLLQPGDRITWTEYFFDGDCYYRDVLDMPQKCPGLEKYGHESADRAPHLIGGFADHCYVLPGTGLLRLPEELGDAEATPLNCGVATMVAVTEAAGISLGETVVVQGLGLLGLYGAALAKARGARCVVGIDPVPARRALACRFGVDLALDAALPADQLTAAVRAACRPDGADAAIEVTGNPAAIPQALPMLRAGGRYVLAGVVTPGAEASVDFNLVLRRCLSLRGVHNYHPRHLVQALDFVMSQRERYPFAELVDGRYPLERIDDAFADASACRVLRAAIIP
jgi:putative phosphonate catabolism associated alcohol dehydrogenase